MKRQLNFKAHGEPEIMPLSMKVVIFIFYSASKTAAAVSNIQ